MKKWRRFKKLGNDVLAVLMMCSLLAVTSIKCWAGDPVGPVLNIEYFAYGTEVFLIIKDALTDKIVAQGFLQGAQNVAEFVAQNLPGLKDLSFNIKFFTPPPISGGAPIPPAGAIITATGWFVLLAGGAFLIYKSGQLLYYETQTSIPGSQPADNKTDYELWYANYGLAFTTYWGSFFKSTCKDFNHN